MNDDPDIRAAAATLRESEGALAELQQDVPSERRGYARMEQLVDIGRVGTPMLFAGVAILAQPAAWLISHL